MPRSRSREKRRSRDRRSRSRDHKRRDRSLSRDRHSKRDSRRDRDRREVSSYDKRERSSERYQSSRHRGKSGERSKKRDHSRDRKRDRSTSRSRKQRRSSSAEKQRPSSAQLISQVYIKPRKVKVPSERSSSSQERPNDKHYDPRNTFEIANEFSREGFEQFTRQNGIDFSNIETEEDRVAVHEKMEDLLKAHFAAQGKVYPPPKVEKPTINAATGFMNDGSFLEQFKKMQDEYKQQQEIERKKKLAEERLKSLPIRRRGGGKILKTGIVAKTKLNEDGSEAPPADAWSIYLKEVQKYKNASCDSDAKTRPLVK